MHSSNNKTNQVRQTRTTTLLNKNHQRIDNAFNRFTNSLTNNVTKQSYQKHMIYFLDWLEFETDTKDMEDRLNHLYDRVIQDKEGLKWFNDAIVDYMLFQRDRFYNKEITGSTIYNYYKPIKLFCEMNDIILNWKRISKSMPSSKRSGQDRIPTLDEIHKLLETARDPRIKPLVLVMTCSGIRAGAWEYLKWKHITPILDREKRSVLAAKLIVYAGEPEEYYSFMTSEAYTALKYWMDYRTSHGEAITGESWIMRDLWRTTSVPQDSKIGLAKYPKQLKVMGLKTMMCRALYRNNIRPILEQGQKRHEFKTMHGFRKFFKTTCEVAGMKPANIELLLGHDIGISSSYYKPTENQLLEDYLKVTDQLTLDERFRLRKEVDFYKQRADSLAQMAQRVQRLEEKWADQ
ncbi:MAG: hypothetical protein L0H53_13370 [Candidatus Nitrosocosmicus sp.]|nr:hypothetical protein [Candidatus Nitrosocosmicus sp.]MDN5866008.1 hypothetical protein [Candidatus Nitrosocosmicus sp.]